MPFPEDLQEIQKIIDRYRETELPSLEAAHREVELNNSAALRRYCNIERVPPSKKTIKIGFCC